MYRNNKHDLTMLNRGQESEIITQRSREFDQLRSAHYSIFTDLEAEDDTFVRKTALLGQG